jgi:hypothetical protein
VGGNDYIKKLFDPIELLSKIQFHCEMVEAHKESGQDFDNAQKLLMEVQTSAAKTQSISCFIQTTLFCHDIDSLYKYFFKTANEIGVECILRIESEVGTETRASCDGIILSLGLISVLDVDDEDKLNDLIDDFGSKIDAELQQLK